MLWIRYSFSHRSPQLISSVSNKHGGEGGPRSALFLFLEEKEVHDSISIVIVHLSQVRVLNWHEESESLVPMEDEDQAERLSLGVRRMDFDQNLGPYPVPSRFRSFPLMLFR